MKYAFMSAAALRALGALFVTSEASADPTPATQTATDQPGTGEGRVPVSDPTGGAYTSPTLLFIPAGAVPAWNVRVTALSEFQTPADTAAAGTNWVGGDVDANGNKKFSLGLSPFFQARLHLYGNANGKGFQLGSSI